MLPEITWMTCLAAAGISSAAAAAFALLFRDWALSFLRKEFGPWLRRVADRQLWIGSIIASAVTAFLVTLPAGWFYPFSEGSIMIWSAMCTGAACFLTLFGRLIFAGWMLQLLLYNALIWLTTGIAILYLLGQTVA